MIKIQPSGAKEGAEKKGQADNCQNLETRFLFCKSSSNILTIILIIMLITRVARMLRMTREQKISLELFQQSRVSTSTRLLILLLWISLFYLLVFPNTSLPIFRASAVSVDLHTAPHSSALDFSTFSSCISQFQAASICMVKVILYLLSNTCSWNFLSDTV